MIDLCPVLEHFIAPLSPYHSSLALRDHHNLKWVDIWLWPDDVQDECDNESVRRLVTHESSSLPALQSCRRLDLSLNVFLDLPMMFPPRISSGLDHSPILWTLGGSVRIIETLNTIKLNPKRVRSPSMHDLNDDAGDEKCDESIDRSDIDSVEYKGPQSSTNSPVLVDESLDPFYDESDDEYEPSESSVGGSSEYWSDEDFQTLEQHTISMARELSRYEWSLDTYMGSEDAWNEYFAADLEVRIRQVCV